jgi:hypothetical protein
VVRRRRRRRPRPGAGTRLRRPRAELGTGRCRPGPRRLGARYVEHYHRTYIGPRDTLVVHHTATPTYPTNVDAFCAQLRSLEAYGHDRDGADVEYHSLIALGLVAEGYAPRYRGCHCTQPHPAGGNYNDRSMGVALLGYYYPPHNDAQRPADLHALARWVAARVTDGDLTPAVFDRAPAKGAPGWYGHQTTGAATACPGQLLEWLPATMAQARALYEGDADVPLTPDEHYQLQTVYEQFATPYEPGAGHEGITPRWAIDRLSDVDVDRIADAVIARLTDTTA